MYAGLKQIPCRSTLSDANNNRDHGFFSGLYGKLHSHYKEELKPRQLPIGNEVGAEDVDIFDSMTITLFKDVVKRAGRNPANGPKKGGMKAFTNMMGHTALTVSLLYKNRWIIELLFKQIKQNFELKYFLSDSENGIRSQIWVALILNLLFTVIHMRIKQAEDFSTLVQVAAKNLSSYIDLKLFLTHTEEVL